MLFLCYLFYILFLLLFYFIFILFYFILFFIQRFIAAVCRRANLVGVLLGHIISRFSPWLSLLVSVFSSPFLVRSHHSQEDVPFRASLPPGKCLSNLWHLPSDQIPDRDGHPLPWYSRDCPVGLNLKWHPQLDRQQNLRYIFPNHLSGCRSLSFEDEFIFKSC